MTPYIHVLDVEDPLKLVLLTSVQSPLVAVASPFATQGSLRSPPVDFLPSAVPRRYYRLGSATHRGSGTRRRLEQQGTEMDAYSVKLQHQPTLKSFQTLCELLVHSGALNGWATTVYNACPNRIPSGCIVALDDVPQTVILSALTG